MSALAEFLGQLLRLFYYLKNPEQNPQFAAIALGLILLVGLLLVTVLLLAYFRLNPLPEKPKKPKKVWQWVRRIMIGLAIFLTLTVISFQATRPKSCLSCHVMKKPFNSWQASTHKNIGCLGCHREPGLIGWVNFTFARLNDAESFARKIYQWNSPIKANVSNKACLSCHEKILNGFSGKAVRMSHKEPVSAGYLCVDCHKKSGHSRKTALKGTRGIMEICLDCHKKRGEPVAAVTAKEASGKCEVCHASTYTSENDLIKRGYIKVQAKPVQNCVSSCHKQKTQGACISCMYFPLPHKKDWVHAPFGFKYFDQCQRCHDVKTFCYPCHEFQSGQRNHGPAWLQEHKIQKPDNCNCHKRGNEWCKVCHGQKMEKKNPADFKYYYQ